MPRSACVFSAKHCLFLIHELLRSVISLGRVFKLNFYTFSIFILLFLNGKTNSSDLSIASKKCLHFRILRRFFLVLFFGVKFQPLRPMPPLVGLLKCFFTRHFSHNVSSRAAQFYAENESKCKCSFGKLCAEAAHLQQKFIIYGDCNESIITVLLAQIAITALSMYDVKRILEHIWRLVFVQILTRLMVESSHLN